MPGTSGSIRSQPLQPEFLDELLAVDRRENRQVVGRQSPTNSLKTVASKHVRVSDGGRVVLARGVARLRIVGSVPSEVIGFEILQCVARPSTNPCRVNLWSPRIM